MVSPQTLHSPSHDCWCLNERYIHQVISTDETACCYEIDAPDEPRRRVHQVAGRELRTILRSYDMQIFI